MVDYNGNIKRSKYSPLTNHDIRILAVSTEWSHDDNSYDPMHFIKKISCLNEVQYDTITSSFNEINTKSIAVYSTSKKEQ